MHPSPRRVEYSYLKEKKPNNMVEKKKICVFLQTAFVGPMIIFTQ